MKTRCAGLIVGLMAVFLSLLSVPSAQASTLGPTWSHYTGHQPYVMVEDHTQGVWPVHAAINQWVYGLRWGPCKTSQCVRVYQTNQGRNGFLGETRWSASGGRFLTMTVTMNSAYNGLLPASERLGAVMHELGHGLGLGHDPYGGVMATLITPHAYISTYERHELTHLYARPY